MANLWCTPNVYLARVDDDLVVLDVTNDRYHCLLGAAGSLRLEADGAIITEDDAIAAELLATGLARAMPLETERPTLISPRRELALSPNPSRAKIFRAGLAWIATTLAFQRKPFCVLLDAHHTLHGRPEERDEVRLADLAGAARKVRPWIPFEGECLQRSFQLRSFLATQGVVADWIFGVRTWPFSAHCWLQIGDLVVGDRLERVRRYTPIMRA